METHITQLPKVFGFYHTKRHYDFAAVLDVFDWENTAPHQVIDMSQCHSSNYQTLALVLLFAWQKKAEGCEVEFVYNGKEGATQMWNLMGATQWREVMYDFQPQFKSDRFKPLLAIRHYEDFQQVMDTLESYTRQFQVVNKDTFRYILSELLYNTLEHGKTTLNNLKIPSIIQFTWYKERNELQFIIADLGIGIKKHLEQTYKPFEDDASAVRYALLPKVSGTFAVSDPYSGKNNAGVGLYLSSNLIRELQADMHIVSGKGLVHISPMDITSRTLTAGFPGTFILVQLRLQGAGDFDFNKTMAILREQARKEVTLRENQEQSSEVYHLSIYNYFGSLAEDKEAAIRYRDRHLIAAIEQGKTIHVNFEYVKTAPHSFLSALFATPIKRLGIQAYKKIRFFNTDSQIRETLDFIMEENT